MQVSAHPHASIVHPHSSSTGLEHPQSKDSSTFVFSLLADFFAISFFALFFLMLAIFPPSFSSTTTSSLTFRCDFSRFGSGISYSLREAPWQRVVSRGGMKIFFIDRFEFYPRTADKKE
jgi:hypothetical protein